MLTNPSLPLPLGPRSKSVSSDDTIAELRSLTSQLLANIARARTSEQDPRRAYELRVAESLALSLEDTLAHMVGAVGCVA